MIATYDTKNPKGELRIRKEPDPKAEIVDTIPAGESEGVLSVDHGWCELADGRGYVDARFVIVEGEDAGTADEGSAVADDAKAEDESEKDAAGAVEGEDAGTAVLDNMSRPDLMNLAKESGIKVSNSMTKKDIIAALLADGD